jgi:hypothetical protein
MSDTPLKSTRRASSAASSLKPTPGGLLTAQQAAFWLGVTVYSLARWREKGCGPDFVCFGDANAKRRRYFYPLEALERFVTERTRKRTSRGEHATA